MSPAERISTRALIREIGRSRTLLIVEHDMDAIFELAERITVLYDGRWLAEGTPEEIQRNQAVQDAYLGGCTNMSLLEVDAINSFYGDSHILFDVSLRVEQNEVVALLGRNGAGKTTTLRTIMGVIAPAGGTIRLDGKPIQGLPPYAIARMGMQLVPEERAIFGALTVEENLRLAALTALSAWPLTRIWGRVPAPGRAAPLGRAQPVGRRTADAGDCPRADPRRADHSAGRTIRGPGAADRARPVRVSRELAAQGRTIVVVEQNVVAALKFR